MLSRLVHWRRPTNHKCVLLGAGWTGKTTLLYKLKTGAVLTTIPTIGFNCETIELGKKVINFWDFGGCDKIAPLARHLLDSESGVLFLVDVAADDEWSRDFSFELLELHAKQLLDAGGQFFWVVLAKQDLLPPETRDETVRKIKEEYESRLRALPRFLKWKVFSQPGLSLFEDDHVWQIFEEIHTTLEQQQEKRPGKSLTASTTEMPTDEELRARIGSEGLTDISAGEFWKLLSTAQLPAWDHRSHLKAGYLIYLDILSKMGSIWDAVEIFLQQLEQLRNSNPQRFTNTQHRTMTIFWLHHIRLAIVRYRDEVNHGTLPSAEVFQQVLLYTPSLMNGRIWQSHYTKSLLFSPEAKENWCLPDLAPLPDYIPKAPSARPQASKPASGEVQDATNNHRLAHFGFLVVREYMTTNQRRGLIIQETLRALHSMTLQLRVTDSSVPPYSETQALFWIQITHAAVAGLPTFQTSSYSSTLPTINVEKKPSLAKMTFETFSSLFPNLKDENLWKKYYTAEVWHSVPARMEFKNPDIRPLPNLIGISQSGSIPRA
ncbi:P-loop containing nucleoside triphosphate hydrolase protein, partial [Mytilinidion resinicola]